MTAEGGVMRGGMLGWLGLFLGASIASAQTPQPPAPIAELRAAFQDERTTAADGLERAAADDLAARAEAAATANDARAAAKLYRDARIALPHTATKPPEHVSRILGTVNGLRHADRVTGLSFSPDAKRLASSSRDGTVIVWNVENERLLLTYRGHAAATNKRDALKIANVVFAPDGKRIASSGGEEIHLWEAATGKLLHKLSGHKPAARGLAFTPDGKRLISGGDDRVVIVWDTDNGKQLFAFPPQLGRIEAVAVHAQGKMFAAVNAAGELTVFPLGGTAKPPLWTGMTADRNEGTFGVAYVGTTANLLTAGGDGKAKLIVGPDVGGTLPAIGSAIRVHTGDGGRFYALAASADGRRFVTAGTDPLLRLWDTETGKLISATVITAAVAAGETTETGLSAAALSADGRWMAAGTVDGLVRILPAEAEADGRKLADRPDVLYAVAAAPSGKVVAVSGTDRAIALIDPETGKELKTLAGHTAAVPALWFLRDGLLASGSGDKLVKLWDTTTGKAIDCPGHTSAVLCLAGDAAGTKLASGSVDRTVRLWDAAGKPLGRWDANSAVTAVALTPDGKRAVVGTANGLLTVVDVAVKDPKTLGSVQAHGSGTLCVVVRGDGKQALSAGGDGFAKLWELTDAGTPKFLGLYAPPGKDGMPPPALTSVALSPDGRTVLTAGADRTLRLWDVNTHVEQGLHRGHGDWITAAIFLPGGRRIVTASADKTVRLIDLPPAVAAGHVGAVTAVAVAPDGRSFATAGKDRTVRLWTAAGEPTGTLAGSAGAITGLGFLSENRLASIGDDGRLRLWSITDRRETKSVPLGGTPLVLVVDPAGQRIVVAVTQTDGAETTAAFLRFDADGKPAGDIRERGRRIQSLAISPDLRFGLSGGEDGTIRIWDLEKAVPAGGDWPLFDAAVLDLGLANDGRTLIALDVKGRRRIGNLVERASGKAEAMTAPASLTLEPKGTRHAVVHEDGTLTLADNAGKTLRTWKLPAAAAALTFAPDGKLLLAAQPDGTTWVLTLP